MLDWLKEQKFILLAAVIISIGGIYYYLFDGDRSSSILEAETDLLSDAKEEGINKQPTQLQQPEQIIVDVKGQVKKPGVYPSSQGERVIDVIHRAGGLTENAEESQVNFAEHVRDEMVIYIPAKGEDGLAVPSAAVGNFGASNGGSANSQAKINLNKADVTELQNLPGIGPAKAAAIIEYREKSGPFKAIEDLKNISGIGEKTFDKLKEHIAIH